MGYDALRTKCYAPYLPVFIQRGKVDADAEEKVVRESYVLWLLAVF